MPLPKSKHTIPKVNQKLYQPPNQARRHLGALVVPESKSRRPVVYQDHYALANTHYLKRIRAVVAGIAVVLILQSLLHIPLLQLRSVHISGVRYLPEEAVRTAIAEDLSRRRWLLFRNDNFFLFSGGRLSQALENRFLVRVTKVEKRFPQTLSVELVERIAAFVVQTPEKYLQLDTTGASIGESQGPQQGQSVIADERAEWGSAIPQPYLELVTSIKNLWEQRIVGVSIEKFNLTDEADRVTVSTDAGFKVYFDRTKDIEKQIDRLSLFLLDTSIARPSEYVDLRFDETLFVK
jgi:hypothetical protein